MNAIPTISVLIAAHNAAPWLEEAVESALRQSHPPLEILVFDDASTDGTAVMLERLAIQSHYVRGIHASRNVGPSDARNALLAQAKGEWIALLDADDAWEPWRIEALVPHMRSRDIVCDNIANWKNGTVGCVLVPDAFFGARQATRLDPLRFVQWNLGLLKPVIRRAFLESHSLAWSPGEFHGEDFDFYLRCLLCDARWLQFPQAGYLYRRHETSLSRSWRDGLVQSRALLARLRSAIPTEETELAAMLEERIADKERIRNLYEWREAVRLRSGILKSTPAALSGMLSLCIGRIRRGWST